MLIIIIIMSILMVVIIDRPSLPRKHANRMTHGSPGSGQQQAGAAAPQLPGAFRRKLPEGPPGCPCRPQPAAGEPVRCPGSTARVGGGVAARQLPLHRCSQRHGLNDESTLDPRPKRESWIHSSCWWRCSRSPASLTHRDLGWTGLGAGLDVCDPIPAEYYIWRV